MSFAGPPKFEPQKQAAPSRNAGVLKSRDQLAAEELGFSAEDLRDGSEGEDSGSDGELKGGAPINIRQAAEHYASGTAFRGMTCGVFGTSHAGGVGAGATPGGMASPGGRGAAAAAGARGSGVGGAGSAGDGSSGGVGSLLTAEQACHYVPLDLYKQLLDEKSRLAAQAGQLEERIVFYQTTSKSMTRIAKKQQHEKLAAHDKLFEDVIMRVRSLQSSSSKKEVEEALQEALARAKKETAALAASTASDPYSAAMTSTAPIAGTPAAGGAGAAAAVEQKEPASMSLEELAAEVTALRSAASFMWGVVAKERAEVSALREVKATAKTILTAVSSSKGSSGSGSSGGASADIAARAAGLGAALDEAESKAASAEADLALLSTPLPGSATASAAAAAAAALAAAGLSSPGQGSTAASAAGSSAAASSSSSTSLPSTAKQQQEGALQKLQEQAAAAAAKATALEEELAKQRTEVSKRETLHAETAEQLLQLRKASEASRNALNNASKEKVELMRELKRAQDEAAGLKEELAATLATAAGQSREKEAAAVAAALAAAEQQRAAEDSARAPLQAASAATATATAAAAADLAAAAAAAQAKEAEFTALQAVLQGELAKVRSQLDEARGLLAVSQHGGQVAEERIKQLQAEADAAGEKLQAAEERAAALQTQLNQKEADLVKEMEAGAAAKAAAEAEAGKLQASIASLQSDKAALGSTIEQLQAASSKSAGEAAAAQQALEKRCAELEATVKLREQELKDLEARAKSREAAIKEKAQAQLVAIKGDILRQVQEDNTVAAAEKAALEARMQQMAAFTAGVQAALAKLQEGVLQMKKQQAASKLEIVSLRDLTTVALQGASAQITLQLQAGKEAHNALVARYKKELAERRRLHNMLQELRGNIRVYCRVRPPLPSELEAGAHVCVSFPGEAEIALFNSKRQAKAWEFDEVFGLNTSNEQIFRETEPLVVSAMDGYNVCIFAYGQTGSGKTFTMEGSEASRGINYRALETLFSLRDGRAGDMRYSISVSMLEIYNETVQDMLAGRGGGGGGGGGAGEKGEPTKLHPREGAGGVFVPDLVIKPVESLEDVLKLMKQGYKNRTTFSTNMNEHSSRSHCMLSVYITGSTLLGSGAGAAASGQVVRGKLHLVDLAGSERVSKSGVTGDRLKEAQAINKSLSALGDVIQARAEKRAHVPFRNSTLTYLLSDSLSGDSKTLMFVNLSPVLSNAEESFCSLNFAARVRSVELGQAKKHVSGGAGSAAAAAAGGKLLPAGRSPSPASPAGGAGWVGDGGGYDASEDASGIAADGEHEYDGEEGMGMEGRDYSEEGSAAAAAGAAGSFSPAIGGGSAGSAGGGGSPLVHGIAGMASSTAAVPGSAAAAAPFAAGGRPSLGGSGRGRVAPPPVGGATSATSAGRKLLAVAAFQGRK